LSRTKDGVLQRQCGFALLVDLMHAVQPLAQATCQHGEQGLILEGKRALLGEINPYHEHAVGVLKRDACRSRL
jgi:hypothetical protein